MRWAPAISLAQESHSDTLRAQLASVLRLHLNCIKRGIEVHQTASTQDLLSALWNRSMTDGPVAAVLVAGDFGVFALGNKSCTAKNAAQVLLQHRSPLC